MVPRSTVGCLPCCRPTVGGVLPWVASWLAVEGSFDEPAQLVDVAHAPLHVGEGGHDGPSFLLGEVA